MGDGNFRPPTESTPLNWSPKIGTGNCINGPYGCAKFGANPSMGASGQMGEIKRFFKFIPFLRELTYRSDPLTDFRTWWLKQRAFVQGCTFWGLRWYCSPLRGEISKTPIFRFVNRHFQAKQAKSWSFTLSKLPHRFQPNFAQWKRPPSSHRGWSQYVPNKSKMADGCQFEKTR